MTAVAARAMGAFSQVKDAVIFAVAPPAVSELGTSTGFTFFLKDNAGLGHEALLAARNQLIGAAGQSKLLTKVRPNGQEDTPQLRIDIDAHKAGALGLALGDVNTTLATAWGGQYIDDFIDRGRVKRVFMQADAPFRMTPDDFLNWSVRNGDGRMVPFSSFATSRWQYGSPRLERFNGVPAMEIQGEGATGVSSGDAMVEIGQLATRLPAGFGIEWSGMSYQERQAGSQTMLLYGLSLLIMTSLAFGLGVLPLAIASGAGSGAQRAIGTGVLGGMLVGTLLGIFFIPLFFVVVQRLLGGARRKKKQDAVPSHPPAGDPQHG